jgi:hypothetical protein
MKKILHKNSQLSTRNLPGQVSHDQRARLTISLASVSRLSIKCGILEASQTYMSRKCGILDILQTYGLPQPLTDIATSWKVTALIPNEAITSFQFT